MNPVNTSAASGAITALGGGPGYAEARRAVEALRRAGYSDDQIGVLGPDEARPEGERSGLPGDPTHTRWEEGTGAGAAVGTVGGGLAGLGVPEEDAR